MTGREDEDLLDQLFAIVDRHLPGVTSGVRLALVADVQDLIARHEARIVGDLGEDLRAALDLAAKTLREVSR